MSILNRNASLQAATERNPKKQSKTLIFYVNGKKITDDSVDPEWTLLTYLRLKLRYNGTKLGCGEGGCGACTVMVSKYDRENRKIDHLSVNACLAPVCSMHGLAVTTVEGIGSTRGKLHVVQERIAKAHGSQCGFCTPGIVMSMYTLLRNKPKPSMEDIDAYFQGNLCRCTGYRPIIEGFRPFTEHWVANESVEMNGESGNGDGSQVQPNGCNRAVNGKCCQLQSSSRDEVAAESSEHASVHAYCPDQEPIFPPELQLSSVLDEQSLVFAGKYMTWFRPTSIEELLDIKTNNSHAKIVVGNTELGIEMKFKNCQYPVMIVPTSVKELNSISETESGVKFGASVTLSKVEDFSKQLLAAHPKFKVKIFSEILKMLNYFAGKQIRNVAALGGNIMTGSPISDLNPIFMSACCEMEVLSASGTRIVKLDGNFFTGYRKNVIKPNELLLSITIPFTEEDEYFYAYKQSRRRDDDIAIVNAAFRVTLSKGTIRHITICYGGMAPTTVMASKTMEFLQGKQWSSTVIEEAFSKLLDDLPLDPGVPGAMVRYRQSLALSFFFKFYLSVSAAVTLELSPVSDDVLSAIEPPRKGKLKSHQFYERRVDSDSKIAVGAPIAHTSALLQASGEAVYCDDLPKQENELYLAFVLSTKAHANLLGIDAARALELDGVVDFVCHKDLPKERNTFGVAQYIDEEVFASIKVTHVGQIIGAIVAVDQSTAKRGARKVRVTYEELPAVITIESAIAEMSYYDQQKELLKGSVENAFAQCDHILSGAMKTGAQEHFYLETNATIAVPKGENGEMEIFSSTQNPSKTQLIVAQATGVPANRIVCRVKRLGGGFGGKETRTVPISAAVAVAAKKVGRPVRIMLDRDEDMVISGWRHPFYVKYKVGFEKDGMVQALDADIYNNAGWSVDLSMKVLQGSMFHSNNAYFLPNVNIRGNCCKTNLPSNTAFRGFGAPQGMMIAENWMNDIALLLEQDPAVIREKNLLRKGQLTHSNQLIESTALLDCWNECLKQSQYYDSREELKRFNAENKWRKRGISIIPTCFGISFTEKYLNQAGAMIIVYTDGSVLVSHGGTEMGQGLHTKMLQVASEALKIDISKIHILETATDKVPNAPPTAASASSDLNGMAIYNACCEINKRLEPYRKDQSTWEEAVRSAYFHRVSLSATGFYATPHLNYDYKTNSGKLFAYFTVGAACSVVEIDCLTGDHQVLKTDIVMDVGQSLNPAIDIGQIEGAFMQGYGMFVMEQMIHSPSGTLLTRGPGAYKIPSFNDIPTEFNVSLLKDASNPHAVYSSRAIGEPPLFLASSVFYAIKDAIIAAREERDLTPIFKLDAPATCERIRMACEDEMTKRVSLLEEGTFQHWGIQV